METKSMARRPLRRRLSPWIEALIQSHGVQREEGGWRPLRAQVIGVGQMSASQARVSDGPMGLLFLSDGAVQIPAVLTEVAWERLQEDEDRENFSSLLNTTVCILGARLLFHMAPELTRCRFFLSVGKLTTAAAGPVKESTPCCMTLPSVRAAVSSAWRAGLSQDQTLSSQSGFELSELLGEWRHDCLQEVMDDIRRRLVASRHPVSPQPSTSTCSTPPRTRHSTGWDLDRVRYKGEEPFSIPVRYLLIPERQDEQPGSKVTEAQDSQSVENPDRRVSGPPAAGRPCESPDSPVEVLITDLMDVPSFNPWDDFPPPSVASDSSSDLSMPMDAIPATTVKSNSDIGAAVQTTAQTTVQPAMQTTAPSAMQTTTPSAIQTTAPSAIQTTAQPAMQTTTLAAMQTTTSAAMQTTAQPVIQTTASAGLQTTAQPALQTTAPSAMQTTAPSAMQTTAQPIIQTTASAAIQTTAQPAMQTTAPSAMQTPTSKGSSFLPPYQQQTSSSSSSSRKTKHSEDSLQALTPLQEEDEVPRSPPSWLFPSQAVDSDLESDSSPMQTTSRRTPSMHSDGSAFSYSYRCTGQNLQDFSHFSVSGSVLQWAVKYLITPNQTTEPSQNNQKLMTK